MKRWTARHRIASVALALVFALVDTLKDPLTHLDLRELARVVACHNYNCVTTDERER